MKQFVIDVENEELIQVLDMYNPTLLNETIPKILIENMDYLLKPIKDIIVEKNVLYNNLNKKIKKK